MSPARFTRVEVVRMWESCQRTTFYVQLTTDEGFTITPTSHRTGSIYTNFEGLSVDEARDRALIEAADWASLLRLPLEPYIEDRVTYEPSMLLNTYDNRRALGEGIRIDG